MPAEEVEYIGYGFELDDPAGAKPCLSAATCLSTASDRCGSFAGGTVPLVEGGADIDVTGENRHDFVAAAGETKMVKMHEAGLAEMQRGFGDIIDNDTLQFMQVRSFYLCAPSLLASFFFFATPSLSRDNLLRLQGLEIAACELRVMVCGVAEVDVQELQRKTLYRNCDMGLQKCKWLFEILAGWQRGEPMCDDADTVAGMCEPYGPTNKVSLATTCHNPIFMYCLFFRA